ncbi:MAG: ribonuclease III [Clostridia bacterium]|nr:ribonuclease III [Clostridia bacterium]
MENAKMLGGAALAYVGDAVLEIYVRERIIAEGLTDTGKMSAEAQKLVRAEKQSELVDALLPLLNEDENEIYKLGRNYKPSSKPRHAGAVEYHRASGFEAVFGYLHLIGSDSRAHELFDAVYGKND